MRKILLLSAAAAMLVFAPSAAAAQSRPFTVTGATSSVADDGNAYTYAGQVVFRVANVSGQPQTIVTSGDCGEFLPITASGWGASCAWDASPYSAVVDAGATIDVTLRIPLPREAGRETGNVTLTVWPSGNTSVATQAVARVTWDSNVPQISVSLIETTFTPALSPRTLVDTTAAHSSRSVSLGITNAGTGAATYSLAVRCSGSVTSCSTSPYTSLTEAPGASSGQMISYAAGAPGVGRIVLTVQSQPRQSGVVDADSIVVTVNVADLSPPVITMTPAGEVVDAAYGLLAPTNIASRGPLTVDVCDADGVVSIFYMYLNNQLVPWETITFPAVTGCYSAIHATFRPPFVTGSNRVVVYASDMVHTPGVDETYIYDDTNDHVAQVTPVRPSPQVGMNQAVVDTFVVRNPGWHSAQYDLSALCFYSSGAACGAPSVTPATIAVAAGASVRVPVSYTGASALGSTTVLEVTATIAGTTAAARGRLIATTATVLPPTIVISPADGTSVAASTVDLQVTWCDPDDMVVSHSATFQGVALNDLAIQFTGCRAARWNAVPINPWNQVITASATDAQGHTTTRTATITYNAPISAFQPRVSPKGGTRRVRPNVAARDTFVVTNAGLYPAAYSLTGFCGSLANCSVAPGSVSLAAGASVPAIVGYQSSVTPDAPDSIRLVATYTSPLGPVAADTAKYAVVAPSIETVPVVTTYVTGVHAIAPGMIELGFYRVRNTGSAQVTYDLRWTFGGGYGFPQWGAPDSVITLDPGQGRDVYAYVRAPSTEGMAGAITLTASYVSSSGDVLSAAAVSSWITRTPRPAIAITPKNTTRVVYPGAVSNEVGFAIANTGNAAISLADSVVCQGVATNCRLSAAAQVLGLADVSGVTVTFDLAAGVQTGSVRLIASGVTEPGVSDNATIALTTSANYIAVQVSPRAAERRANRSRTFPQRYYVTNAGNAAGWVTLATSCDLTLVCSTPQPASVYLGAGQRDSTLVSITSPDRDSVAGRARLIASATAPTTSVDTGVVTITSAILADLVVSVGNASSGVTIARDQCLTIAAGDGAAYECGDLRLAHVLPATTTMNHTRAPMLTYVSRHASGVVLFPADVSVSPGNGVTSIHVRVTVDGRAPVDTVFRWDDTWSTGTPRRVVIPVDVIGRNMSTGAYHYTFSVDAASSVSAIQSQDEGMVAVVNRAQSPFGAGWWLDGLEQLVAVDSAHKLWVGGDGNTRLYTRLGTGPVWLVQPTVDGPDSLLAVGPSWQRSLGNGAYVEFDNLGRHVATRNAKGHATLFGYDNAHPMLLSTITLPVPEGAPVRQYVFSYDAVSQRLASIDAPGTNAPRRTRIVPVSVNGSWTLDSIVDPDARSTSFSYFTNLQMRTRTDRAGHWTSFDFDEGGALRRTIIDMAGTAAEPIIRRFCAAESASLTTCAFGPRDTAELLTMYDGPRAVNDTARYYITKFGAPRLVINALGDSTLIEHGDPRWPLLVTRLVDPRGHEVRAVYDSVRALLRSSTDVNPNAMSRFEPAQAARTQYVWHPVWDRVSRVIAPSGVVSGFEYDVGTGDRLAEYTGDARLRPVHYDYDPLTRLLKQVTTLQSASPTTYEYDALGNLNASTSPRGVRSTWDRDLIGRDTLDSDAIDGTWRKYRKIAYDTMSRVIRTVDSARTTASDATPQLLIATYGYDAAGNTTNVLRAQSPDPLHVGSMLLKSEFDAANRKTLEYDPDRTDATGGRRWEYDAAGNVVKAWRDGDSVTTQYDELDRPIHRIVGRSPALSPEPWNDEQTFSYDPSGNLISAKNRYARILRGHTLRGAVQWDSLQIANEDGSFSGHVFGTSHGYDAAGRRTLLIPPQGLGVLDPVTYDYDVQTGDLSSVNVQSAWLESFRYYYSPSGLLDSLTRPGRMSEHHGYDDDGREILRVDGGGVVGSIHNETVRRDERGKMLWVSTPGLGRVPSETFGYDGMGGAIGVTGSTIEETPRDPLGNAVRRDRAGNSYSETYWYEPHSTRLHTLAQQLNDNLWIDSVTHAYSAAGDLSRQLDQVTGPAVCGPLGARVDCQTGRRVIAYSNTFNTYDANGRLVRAVKETSNDGSSSWPDVSIRDPNSYELYPKFERGVTESYRYDALGRRVWVKAYRDASCAGPRDRDSTNVCLSTIERTIYDGDQALAEIRQPAEDSVPVWQRESDGPVRVDPVKHFGVMGYVHGPVLDQPLELIRDYGGGSIRLIPHYQWRGALDVATTLDGNFIQCGVLPAGSSWCEDIEWAGARTTFGMVIPTRTLGPASWWGTLVDAKQNATGMLDMRNRQYDPKTGRFTQEDPIGLAGGMNLYGFGGGDAVSYSDPFGLCPKDAGGNGRTEGYGDCAAGTSGWYANRLATGEGSAALNWIGGSLAACNESWMCQGVLAVAGNTTVYIALEEGAVKYVGITKNLLARAAAHFRDKRIAIRAVDGLEQISRSDARAVEQTLIEMHGLAKNGGSLLNKINSIARSNPIYADALRRGTEILRGVGYPVP